MGFRFEAMTIPEVVHVQPDFHKDARGYFSEIYKSPIFHENGIPSNFVQVNQSQSKKGTLRGLHYQKDPSAQAKLVRAIKGEIFDVAVDMRKGSPTFGKWVGVTLTSEKNNLLFIPEGFAHGFYALSDIAEVVYFTSNTYAPDCDSGVIYNDPDIGIVWPEGEKHLSEKDAKLPTFKEADNNFNYKG